MLLVSMLVFFFVFEIGLIASLLLFGRYTERLIVAPGLDIVVSLLTWVPWVLAFSIGGWIGIIGCILGQIGAMEAFCFWHESRHPDRGPSIARTLNQLTSPMANNVALFATLPALPAFILIRFSQLTTYPILVRTVRLPPYKDSEWVNISRQKFEGLIGHDLVWCLYCDWMTGIYALGGEMLRNLESFWCPIRFYPGKKCENCQIDFPDLSHWVPADGTLEDVKNKLVEKYEGRRWNSWWGHPDRNPEKPMHPPLVEGSNWDDSPTRSDS